MTADGRCCVHPAQMALAHHGVEHLVGRQTTEKWSPRHIASSTLFVHARRSSKTPRPEKVTRVARNCTEKCSVDWCSKSAFKMMYFFCQARPNHAPTLLGVQGVTRPTHVKFYAPGVQFSTPRACCTTLVDAVEERDRIWPSTAISDLLAPIPWPLEQGTIQHAHRGPHSNVFLS